jgi:hypothetical protein
MAESSFLGLQYSRSPGSVTYRGSGKWCVADPCAASTRAPPHPDKVRSSARRRGQYPGLRVAALNRSVAQGAYTLTEDPRSSRGDFLTPLGPSCLTIIIGLGWVRIAAGPSVGGSRAWAPGRDMWDRRPRLYDQGRHGAQGVAFGGSR